MDQYEAIIRLLMKAAKEDALGSQANGQDSGQCPEKDDRIPVGISNRHVHLSREDLSDLFGAGYELTKMKDLSQPGQYACKETVTICGPKGAIEKVRILGPVRPRTQVEILSGDSFKLGIKAPARLSGDLDKTPGITIIGPRGSVQTKEGLMAAQRHIHMLPQDAARFGVHDGQNVSLEIDGIRGGILRNTIVRVTGQSGLECHIDTEEANALGLDSSSTVKIIK
ncbi:phosphate propanoyltransferase [Enterocloster citroniae]|uniref:phosphate propanoyltransferase n=1 Tax=Enterocloster citroniae TaxID=358743 RepID=UPI00349EC23D